MATASIKFTQGTNVGTLGQVLECVAGQSVLIENAVDATIRSWRIELLVAGPGSGLAPGILAQNANSSTPSATVTPDVMGSFRIRTTVWDAPNFVGAGVVDIRNIMIRGNRFFLPPYQQDPEPLPTLASGLPSAQPNETNLNGSELGWQGDGSDGLLADLVKAVDTIFPIQTARPSSIVQVTGSTGEPVVINPVEVAITDANIIIFGVTTYMFQRSGLDAVGIDAVLTDDLVSTSNKYFYTDSVWTGSQLFLFGSDGNLANGFVRELVPTGNMSLGAQHVLDAGNSIGSADYDGTSLWAGVSATGDIYKINPATPGTIAATLSIGNPIGVVRVDQSIGKGFVIDTTVPAIKRFSLSSPAVDATLATAFAPYGLSVGTGSDAGAVFFGGAQTVKRINTDLVTSPVTASAIPYWLSLNSIDYYDTGTERCLLVTAETAQGDIVLAKLNAQTLALVGLSRISETHLNAGYGSAAPFARVRAVGTKAFVGDTFYSQFGTDLTGDLYQVDFSTGSLRSSGTAGHIASTGTTLTDSTKNFVTAGVQVGDLLVNSAEAGTYYYHRITNVAATVLTIADTFSATSTTVTYEVYRPMTKSPAPGPGPKRLELVDCGWQPFNPYFLGVQDNADIGDGQLVGYYRLSPGIVEVQLGFIPGSTTVFDPAGMVIPFPPGIYADLKKLPSANGVTLFHGIFGDAQSANGGIYDIGASYVAGALLVDLSIIPTGDPGLLRFSFPRKMF